jgi:GAF domain-containing protein
VGGGVRSLQDIADELRKETGASRATVRGLRDVSTPASASRVELLAESLAEGVPSMHDGPQPGIVEAPTYVELNRTHALIIQDDCRVDEPRPPQSLISHYRVYAQMLAPVVRAGEMVGTISVHQQDRPRRWSADEIDALSRARAEVEAG